MGMRFAQLPSVKGRDRQGRLDKGEELGESTPTHSHPWRSRWQSELYTTTHCTLYPLLPWWFLPAIPRCPTPRSDLTPLLG